MPGPAHGRLDGGEDLLQILGLVDRRVAAHHRQKLEALVLDKLPHRYRLMLPDILLELFMTTPATVKLSPGDTVLVRLDRVNPREDQIKVSLA